MKESQNRQILQYLQKHGSITSWDAITRFRCTRLSARIADLKEQGHGITSDWETNDDGKRYKVYTLCAEEREACRRANT